MAVADTFAYDGPWDRVGLDCAYCSHFYGPPAWPDKKRISACKLHRRSLEVELGANCYKNREWFCRDFTHAAGASKSALTHFDLVKKRLPEDTLFGLHTDTPFLEEISFGSLPET